jgi:hypothetical protein
MGDRMARVWKLLWSEKGSGVFYSLGGRQGTKAIVEQRIKTRFDHNWLSATMEIRIDSGAHLVSDLYYHYLIVRPSSYTEEDAGPSFHILSHR